MNNTLVVNSKTVIASTEAKEKDILDYYGIPAILDRFLEKDKKDVLNSLCCGTMVVDALNQIAHADDFIVEIPKGLRKKLETGEAVFDTSSKTPGSNTPNIRLKGGKEIVGQATIAKKTDSLAVSRSLSNLAMMAMVQKILSKIDVLDEKVEDLKRGQMNDRVGSIIGPFKAFMDLYPTLNTTEQIDAIANSIYLEMQKGLSQIHLHINEVREKLNKAPNNNLKVFWHGIIHPFRSDIDKYRKLYNEYIISIQLYNRLSLLSDVILHLKNAGNAMCSNHKTMYDYCNQQLTDSFKNNMRFLLNREPIELDRIHEYNVKLDKILKEVQNMDLVIECKQEDVKLLNTTQQ